MRATCPNSRIWTSLAREGDRNCKLTSKHGRFLGGRRWAEAARSCHEAHCFRPRPDNKRAQPSPAQPARSPHARPTRSPAPPGIAEMAQMPLHLSLSGDEPGGCRDPKCSDAALLCAHALPLPWPTHASPLSSILGYQAPPPRVELQARAQLLIPRSRSLKLTHNSGGFAWPRNPPFFETNPPARPVLSSACVNFTRRPVTLDAV